MQSGLDRQRDAQHVGQQRLDQVPVHCGAEQRVDVRVVAVLVRPGEVQVLPVADARHQPDSEQVGQAEDRRTLALGVGVEGVGLERRPVLADEVQD